TTSSALPPGPLPRATRPQRRTRVPGACARLPLFRRTNEARTRLIGSSTPRVAARWLAGEEFPTGQPSLRLRGNIPQGLGAGQRRVSSRLPVTRCRFRRSLSRLPGPRGISSGRGVGARLEVADEEARGGRARDTRPDRRRRGVRTCAGEGEGQT